MGTFIIVTGCLLVVGITLYCWVKSAVKGISNQEEVVVETSTTDSASNDELEEVLMLTKNCQKAIDSLEKLGLEQKVVDLYLDILDKCTTPEDCIDLLKKCKVEEKALVEKYKASVVDKIAALKKKRVADSTVYAIYFMLENANTYNDFINCETAIDNILSKSAKTELEKILASDEEVAV